MLSKAEIEAMSDEIVGLYREIEDDMIANVAKRLKVTNQIAQGDVAAYHIERMNDAGALRRDNVRAIAKYSGKSEAQITKLINDAGFKAIEADEAFYIKAHNAGALPMMPVNAQASTAIKNILKSAANNTKAQFNLINTTAIEQAQKGYLNILNKAMLSTEMGITDYQSAIRKAVGDFAGKGITGAHYISDKGNMRTDHIEVAVRRNMKTALSQTAGDVQMARAKEWKSNLVEVTSYIGARPTHAAWQGKIYSIDGSTAKYPNLADVTGYGSVGGLCGANCGHRFFPFIEGVSEQRYFPVDAQKNNAAYELSQDQRRIERDIREQKRRILAAEKDGNDAAKVEAQKKLVENEKKRKEFIDKTGRTKRAERERIEGFDSKKAAEARRIGKGGTPTPKTPTPQPRTPTPKTPKPQAQTQKTPQTPAGSAQKSPVQTTAAGRPIKGTAQTVAEAEREVFDKVLAQNCDLSGITNIDSINEMTGTMQYLKGRYKTKALRIVQAQKTGKDGAWASANGGSFRPRTKFYNNPANEVKDAVGAGWQGRIANNVKVTQSYLDDAEKILANPSSPSWEIKWAKETKKKCEKALKEYSEFAKYPRHNVVYAGREVESVTTHEFGHTIADQRFGQCNTTYFRPTYYTDGSVARVQMVRDAMAEAKRTGDIYKISAYSTKNEHEFFAEAFTMYSMGIEQLPKYIVDMIEAVIA